MGVQLLETSAKDSTNVEQSFMTMAAEIKKRAAAQPSLAGGKGTIKPGEGKAIGGKSSCC